LGRDDIHAHSKLDIARAWRRAHPDARAFVVGDTEHDCEAAQAMEADCYLIAGGHQSKERLLSTGAPVFDSLPELAEYLIREKKI
jgi:phosphoglycolate phosphatase